MYRRQDADLEKVMYFFMRELCELGMMTLIPWEKCAIIRREVYLTYKSIGCGKDQENTFFCTAFDGFFAYKKRAVGPKKWGS